MTDVLPSKFAVAQVCWGEKKRHMYVLREADVEMFATKEQAVEALTNRCRSDPAATYALLQVVSISKAKPAELETIEA